MTPVLVKYQSGNIICQTKKKTTTTTTTTNENDWENTLNAVQLTIETNTTK